MIINNVLSYDIETIPEEVSELTSTQTEQIQKKLDRYLKAHPEEVVNKESIRNMQNEFGYLIDPHTAVGVLGLIKYRNETNSKTKGVVLSTAHPGKFADVIEPIIGDKTTLPESLQIAMKKEKNSIKMPKKFSDLKEYLLVI